MKKTGLYFMVIVTSLFTCIASSNVIAQNQSTASKSNIHKQINTQVIDRDTLKNSTNKGYKKLPREPICLYYDYSPNGVICFAAY